MPAVSSYCPPLPWHTQLGSQRDWVWRGWQIRYTYLRVREPLPESVPIVFLHGFGAALTQWRLNLEPLSQHHTVYALDFLGFGASEKGSANYKVDLWMAQVRDFCREIVGRPVVLVGHSLGALVALAIAAHDPALVQGLILLTLPASRQELLPGKLQSVVGEIESFFSSPLLLRPLFSLVRRPGVIRSVLRAVYANPEAITDELVRSFAIPAGDRGAAKVLCRLVQARTQTDFSPSTKALLQAVNLPILLLWGQKDRIIPLAWGRQLPAVNSRLKLIELPNAGHCPYDECADRVNQEILAWVDHCVGAVNAGAANAGTANSEEMSQPSSRCAGL